MAQCPLCILGLSEKEHTPERWQNLTKEEMDKVHAFLGLNGSH